MTAVPVDLCRRLDKVWLFCFSIMILLFEGFFFNGELEKISGFRSGLGCEIAVREHNNKIFEWERNISDQEKTSLYIKCCCFDVGQESWVWSQQLKAFEPDLPTILWGTVINRTVNWDTVITIRGK